MAVRDESLHHATDALILSQPRPYYQASIHTSHWQLRSLIGSPEQGVIFYPQGRDIYALYPKTRDREIVTTLSFSPRCLTVAGGWLCCGGHHGDYTAISISDNELVSNSFMGLDPDARLPLDFDPLRRLSPRETPSTSHGSHGHSYPLSANVKRIGTESDEKDDAINNCITLWLPSKTASKMTYSTPVAVVANNDKNVYILSIPESEVLEKLSYPDCVNRAVMSPDGNLLVAVLDDPFLYVHQRKPIKLTSTTKLPYSKQTYSWVKVCRIQLDGQSSIDKSTMKGSFALTFSNSGKYLAVATQYGVVSIFDVETFTHEDAEPLALFTSSRPGRQTGAIRDMEFSPGPVDLLAWTETSGRVGVADLRNLFLSRQLLMVDCRLDGVEKINIKDRPGEAVIDPRLRSFQTDSPSLSSTTPDYLGLDLERRQLRHLTREMQDRHQAPLTTEELEVLQAHRIARRQRDALAESSNGSSWGTGGNGEMSANSDRRLSTTGLPAALQEFVNPDRTAASFRSFINERNLDRERRSQQEPRRRSSVILAAAERAIEQEAMRTRSSRHDDSSYYAQFSAEAPPDRSSRLRIEFDDDEPLGFTNRLRRPFGDLGLVSRDESTVILRGVLRRSNDDDERPRETMGLCWSPDGRVLYVGAEDGIYEYHVNIASRKKFPSVVFR